MTQDRQKIDELNYANHLARLVGQSWSDIRPSESPDFLIYDGNHRFGLEVTNVFNGDTDRRGAQRRRAESDRQGMIDEFRQTYERTSDVPLRVKFLGQLSPARLEAAVEWLQTLDVASKPVVWSHREEFPDGLIIFVSRYSRSEWFILNDRIGFVDQSPIDIIQGTIKTKSLKIDRYRIAAPEDIRLLVVADCFWGSGLMQMPADHQFDRSGFDRVYLMAYPADEVVVI